MLKDLLLQLVEAKVHRADRPFDSRVIVEGGTTRPFVLERGWSGPSGSYLETWSIRRGEGREIVHESAARPIFVRGIQSVTRFSDLVSSPINLEPGTYDLVFVVEGRFMGSATIIAVSDDVSAP